MTIIVCTHIYAWRVYDEVPLCVAANRDETLSRPFKTPHVWNSTPSIFAPKDTEEGGTWIGYNKERVLIGMTNRWLNSEGRRSRGLLVRDCLKKKSAKRAVDYAQSELKQEQYRPFHLVCADDQSFYTITHNGEGSATTVRRDPGIYVAENVGFGGEWFIPLHRAKKAKNQIESAKKIYERMTTPVPATCTEWKDIAKTVLQDHKYGACRHGDGYGTKSSSIITVGETINYYFAEGSPCKSNYKSISVPFS